MDQQLLDYYENELRYLWDTGQEFKQAFPKVARRLGIEDRECSDPYVERLLEGFAFLAARVHLKIDAQFPRFTQHLLETVYPHYLAPMPSMAIVQLEPDLAEGSIADGFSVPRGSRLLSGTGDGSECEFRTAHEVTLWPIELISATYESASGALSELQDAALSKAKAELRIRLHTKTTQPFQQLPLDRITLFLVPRGELGVRLYECLTMHVAGVAMRVGGESRRKRKLLRGARVEAIGFRDQEALLPPTRRSFSGYRLLQEYFSFPQRFLFIEINGLADGVRECRGEEAEISVLLNRAESELEREVSAESFALHCTPAINLFRKRADPILIKRQSEHQIVVDIPRPMDYEVYSVEKVTGYGRDAARERRFQPLYALPDGWAADSDAYYTVQRRQRLLSRRPSERQSRHDYIGSEVFLSLVDAQEAPFSGDLRQLSVIAQCTNRDLPLEMVSLRETHFRTVSGEPVATVRILAGPTKPRPSHVHGDTAWRTISHLALNYLSLTDLNEEQGATALRELLRLYGDGGDSHIVEQIEGIRSVATVPIVDRIPTDGPVTFGRGLEITLEVEEAAFVGTGAFLLGSVLARFFARYVSINSFTRTVLKTVEGNHGTRVWPVSLGKRPTL